jgi:hypothetical protein
MVDFITNGYFHSICKAIYYCPFIHEPFTGADEFIVIFTPNHNVDVRANFESADLLHIDSIENRHSSSLALPIAKT